MNYESRERIIRSLKKRLLENEQFEKATLEFIIRKQNEYIVHFSDQNNNEFIGVLNDEETYIPISEIEVEEIMGYVFEGCVEAFFLSRLTFGCEVIYVSLWTHDLLWDFIHEFKGIADLFENGTIKYLKFCQNIGISYEMMNYYFNQKDNLYEKYGIICPMQRLLKSFGRVQCNEC